MKTLALLLSMLSPAFGAYTYYYTDALTSIDGTKWTQNGSVTATTGGLTSPDANAAR